MPFTFQDGSPLLSYCALHFHFPGWLTSLRLLCLSSRLEQDPRIRPRLTTSPSGFTTGCDFLLGKQSYIFFFNQLVIGQNNFWNPSLICCSPLSTLQSGVSEIPIRNYQNCHHLTCRFTSAFLFLATALLALNNFFGKVNLQLPLRDLNWEGVSKA